MPRPKAAATAPDVLDEIRAFRAKRDGMIEQVRKRRAQAESVIVECDQALAELGAAVERAVAPVAVVAKAVVAKATGSPKPTDKASSTSVADRRIAEELSTLQPWIPGLRDHQRKVVSMRLAGKTTGEIAQELGATTKDVSNAIYAGRARLRELRSRSPKAETPASDDEGEPAPAHPAFADLHPRAPQIAREMLERRAPANDIPPPATVGERPEPQKNIPKNIPAGWDRSDPGEDFTDIEPAALKADPAHVHLWSPESGGTPACTLAFDGAARTTTDRSDATCPACLAIQEPEQAGPDQRPPNWVLGWLSPEIRRAYQGVALEGLSPQTMAWTEDVSPNVISGRVNGARQKVKRLLRWEAERAAEGNPLTDSDRAPPPAYREPPPDQLLAILQRPVATDGQAGDETPATPAVERVRAKLSVIDGRIRAKTISAARLSRAERVAGADLDYPDVERPRTRGECQDEPRPCPFVSCSHHLYLEVNPDSGAIKLNFPHLEVWEMVESCSLDVADRGGITLEEVGATLNITRSRVLQIEVRGLDEIRDSAGDELGGAPERRGSPLAEAIGD